MVTLSDNVTSQMGLRSSSVTLHDVASRVGVAPITVSRALNGGQVSAQVRENVLKAVQEMGYRPNLAARSMRSQKSRQVGIVLRNSIRAQAHEIMAHPLTWGFLMGINDGLEEAGYIASLLHFSNLDDEILHPSALQGQLLDGMIVVSDVPAVQPEQLEALVPHCLWLDSSVWKEHNCIRRDEVQAGELAAQFLVDKGYTELVYLCRHLSGANTHYSETGRRSGVRAVVEAANLEWRTLEAVWDEELESLVPQVAALPSNCAIVANDAYLCRALLDAALLAGKRPGHDFALVCCDQFFSGAGFHLFDRYVPYVSFDRFQFGRRAATMMRNLLETGEAQPSIQISNQLHEGVLAPNSVE